MKTHFAFLLALVSSALAQGPLTPPPGADPGIGPVNALTPGGLPQATMKTLHQVEPRTAIPAGASTVVINQSGSYYLTGNIQVAASHGVDIQAGNVTLDLNGFSISSSAGSPDSVGITISAVSNVSISNGSIAGGFLVGIGSFNGSQTPKNVRVTDVSVSSCPNWGILLEEEKNTRVTSCLVDGAVGGIKATLVSDCSVSGGFLTGRIVKDCSATTSGTQGITAMVAENCYSTSAGNAINAKCLVNSYGTGGGSNNVIDAGVAQNVWAEGGNGSGKGISANVVSVAYAKRQPADNSTTGSAIEADVVAQASSHSFNNAISSAVASDVYAFGGLSSETIITDVGSNLSSLLFGGDRSAIKATSLVNASCHMEAGSIGNGAVIDTQLGIGLYSAVSTNSYADAIKGTNVLCSVGTSSSGTGIASTVAAHSYGTGLSSAIDGELTTSCYGRADNGGVASTNQTITGINSHFANGCYGVASNGISTGIKATTAAHHGVGIGISAFGAAAPKGVDAFDIAVGMFGRAPGGTPVDSQLKINSN